MPGESEDSKDKKNRTGTEAERGAKRNFLAWEELAKRMRVKAEARAAESKNPGEGVDVNQPRVANKNWSSVHG